MAQVIPINSFNPNTPHIVVVGSGPTGIKFIQNLLSKNPFAKVTLFGNEPNKPYNRVQLSAFLAGDVTRDAIDFKLPDEKSAPNFSFVIAAITEIDKDARTVTDSNGKTYDYHDLVLSVGSRAHMPDIPGIDQKGVYTFRHLHDTEHLFARVTRCRHCVILGGGLLGLEAARAMRRFNTKVTVIQQATRLMNRQLDDEAAELLKTHVEDLGIEIKTGAGVRHVLGEQSVEGVVLRSGETIECDTVIVCAGITPNVELARNSDIPIGRGIRVDDNLKTDINHVYAIGECCEHNGQTYGLAAPGYEQAAVLADRLSGGNAVYQGSIQLSKLKVVGESVCSIGDIVDLPNRPMQYSASYRDKETGVYRTITTYKGRILGAIGIGEWPEQNRIQDAFRREQRIYRWQLGWFTLTGKLWPGEQTDSISQWPSDALICQCNGISKGALEEAVAEGAGTVEALQEKTTAGTVCGSCKPLLAEMCGTKAEVEKEPATAALNTFALVAVIVVIALLAIPAREVADSVLSQGWFEKIWNDKFWKQVTGFTLLGLSVIGLLLSLRKRLNWKWLGKFAYLRAVHALLGLACVSILIMHTGFNLGHNLNQLLLFNFVGIVLLGAIAGLSIDFSRKLKPTAVQKVRDFWRWLHIMISWPLPALLAVHILTVYYY